MNNCPVCNKSLSLTNMSMIKVNEMNLCQECIKRISKKVPVWNIKKMSVEDLKKIIRDDKIANGEIIECPNCQSHNIDVIATDKNYKEKYKTTLNLNPLKIFTLTNAKKVVKETSKEHNDYLCKDCGNRWIGK